MTATSFWRICLKADEAVQRKSVPVFAVLQVPTAQNNHYTQVAYFGLACPESLQSYFGLAYSVTL